MKRLMYAAILLGFPTTSLAAFQCKSLLSKIELTDSAVERPQEDRSTSLKKSSTKVSSETIVPGVLVVVSDQIRMGVATTGNWGNLAGLPIIAPEAINPTGMAGWQAPPGSILEVVRGPHRNSDGGNVVTVRVINSDIQGDVFWATLKASVEMVEVTTANAPEKASIQWSSERLKLSSRKGTTEDAKAVLQVFVSNNKTLLIDLATQNNLTLLNPEALDILKSWVRTSKKNAKDIPDAKVIRTFIYNDPAKAGTQLKIEVAEGASEMWVHNVEVTKE